MESAVLTKRQHKIFDFILSSIDRFGYPPSIPEIQKEFSFKSPNAVSDHLEALQRKGYIFRRAHKSRGIEIKVHTTARGNGNGNVAEIPVVGRVAAGSPVLAQENIEGTIAVGKHLVRNSEGVFALKVKGDSMINAGILDGDYVIVNQQQTADQGDIVVALIGDEATLKRFYKEKNKIRLQPENDTMDPIMIDPKENEVRVIGKIKGVMRKI